MARRPSRHDRPSWSPVTNVIEGHLPPGPFDFERITSPPTSPLRSWGFFEVRARDAIFDLDEVHLGVAWSEFEGCAFRQRLRRSIDGVWPQGNPALRPSVYRRCTFEGLRFRIRAGYSVGQARFESCVFRRCRFEEHFSFCADYVECRFEGRIRTAVFYGRAPASAPCPDKINEFVRNDFRFAELGDNIGWRGGVDVAAQRWPPNYEPMARP